ncbi:hypothetical protein BASA60_001836 [Batrachochytrium salamandrivorans]|nr:hypothetical protein BASA60_001836 [Batrachochytrium salamandrivorans]
MLQPSPSQQGLSGKYSNNADTNLAFGLEARSYQPVLNSQRDSATFVLLKRQDDSEGSPEGYALKEWAEDSGENRDIVIKSGLGDEEYAKVESSLKEANEKLKADASGDMQQVTDAVSAIGETPGSVKPEMETIQTSLGRTLDAYKVYFWGAPDSTD